jgi:uncharacterized protein (TIGR03083 family)
MTTTPTTAAAIEPLRARLPRPVALQLAATEYQRVVELLRTLSPEDWTRTTDCPGWDVRAMSAHMLGMVEMAASLREQARQNRAAARRGGVFIDALTAVQVEQRADLSPAQIVDRLAARAPKAVRGRRRTPGFVRRRTMPVRQRISGREEPWTFGYLVDVILTRDPWMHRVDITRATGARHVLTAAHDGVLVADVVTEWASRHGRPHTLRLTGPAGGSWSVGAGGPAIDMDAVDFCRTVSGRAPADGLLGTEVPF